MGKGNGSDVRKMSRVVVVGAGGRRDILWADEGYDPLN